MWASEDPAAEDIILYRYCGNGPTDGVDPSGQRIFFQTQPGGPVGPKQGTKPTRGDYPKGAEGTDAFSKAYNAWLRGGQTPNTITMYVLLRYSVAKDSAKSITPKQLEAIAEIHKRCLEGAINNAKPPYDYVDTRGRSFRVRAAVIIRTDHAQSLEDYNNAKRGKTGDEAARARAYFDAYGEFGAFTSVQVTTNVPKDRSGREYYNSGLVPANNTGWKDVTLEEVLLHELLGHGMNNQDEENKPEFREYNKDILVEALGKPIESDAIMTYGKGKCRFYPRNWEAGFQDKSNIPGKKVVSGDEVFDNTTALSITDPWFKKRNNLVERRETAQNRQQYHCQRDRIGVTVLGLFRCLPFFRCERRSERSKRGSIAGVAERRKKLRCDRIAVYPIAYD